ncbi:MAG: Gmad2 immunoglobulin-like domain-containing protein [bacterium]
MKKYWSIVLYLVIAAAVGIASYYYYSRGNEQITLGQDEQVQTSDEIAIEQPAANTLIGTPLAIVGKARGSWFFEGVFPVKLVDADGKTIAQGFVQSQGNWMTDDWVDFMGTLQFPTNNIQTAKGKLIFMNDNPSGLPANAKNFEWPIKFAESNK